MRSTTPTLHCDGEDGGCGTWDVDYYACAVSSVNGVRITKTTRAPEWRSTESGDFCPEHAGAEEETA